MNKILLGGIMALLMSAGILSLDATNPPVEQNETSNVASSALQNYKQIDYLGYTFEVPEECIVDNGNALTVKYPDGSFGISVTHLNAPGTDIKRAESLCKGIAKNIRVNDAVTEKVKINGRRGVLCKGNAEGENIEILLLPAKGKEFTAMMVFRPGREEFAQRFLRTVRPQ